ncbi:hypothetical protein DSECCO2_363490 [anaerobic digester metagenome]|nr:hypothetical protein [Methanomassiliicoccales archaeon]
MGTPRSDGGAGLALKRDHHGMALLVDALMFLVVLIILSAVISTSAPDHDPDDGSDLLRPYHTVMLTSELLDGNGSSMSAATLSEYLIALSLSGVVDERDVRRIGNMVKGTIAELEFLYGKAWLVIEIGPKVLNFGSVPPDDGSDVHADRRELGDGSTVSTLFMAG